MGTVKSLKEAQARLERVQEIKATIEERRRISGINELEAELDLLKKSVTDWAVKTNTETIPMDGGHAQLRRDKYGGTWVGTYADLDGAPDGAVPLWRVIMKKFPKSKEKRNEVWRRVTKRVVDSAALSQAVEEGVFTVEEIEQSYWEKQKTPYIRIYVEE